MASFGSDGLEHVQHESEGSVLSIFRLHYSWRKLEGLIINAAAFRVGFDGCEIPPFRAGMPEMPGVVCSN